MAPTRIRSKKSPRKYSVPNNSLEYKGQIALCFLVVQNIKNMDVWRKFLKGYEKYFNIYVHISGDKYDLKDYWYPEMWNNRVEAYGLKHIDTKWGTVSLVKAESIIYKAALKNKENKYFCMLSESDIPLWTFPELYKFVMNRPKKSYLSFSTIRGKDEDVFTECFPERYIPSSNHARSRNQRDRRTWKTWSSSQWKILNRRDCKEFVRMASNKIYVDSYDNCFLLEPDRLAPDEYMFSNWISLKYGTKELKKRFINYETTFADFKDDDPVHAIEYEDISTGLKEDFCFNKPMFARKFKVNSVKLLKKLPVKC
jgi:hypothetical protein